MLSWLPAVVRVPDSSAGSDQLSGPVRMDGSSTVFPISEAVAEEYLLRHREFESQSGYLELAVDSKSF